MFEIADQFTVFRNGRHIVSDSARNIDNDQFIYYMTGRKIEQDYFDPKDVDYNRSLFRVENLCLKNGFENISFDIHPGRFLESRASWVPAGRSLRRLYSAFTGRTAGKFCGGQEVLIKSPMDALRLKIAYVPEDRLTEGLFLTQSIENNMIVSNIDRLRKKNRTVDFERGHVDSKDWVRNLG